MLHDHMGLGPLRRLQSSGIRVSATTGRLLHRPPARFIGLEPLSPAIHGRAKGLTHASTPLGRLPGAAGVYMSIYYHYANAYAPEGLLRGRGGSAG